MTFTGWKHYGALACGAIAAAATTLEQTDPAHAATWGIVAKGALFVGGALFAVSPSVMS
jgi:hypothetical protein